jgi:hypothetical protein
MIFSSRQARDKHREQLTLKERAFSRSHCAAGMQNRSMMMSALGEYADTKTFNQTLAAFLVTRPPYASQPASRRDNLIYLC